MGTVSQRVGEGGGLFRHFKTKHILESFLINLSIVGNTRHPQPERRHDSLTESVFCICYPILSLTMKKIIIGDKFW